MNSVREIDVLGFERTRAGSGWTRTRGYGSRELIKPRLPEVADTLGVGGRRSGEGSWPSLVRGSVRPMQPLIGLTMYGRIERPMPTEHYEEHFSVPVVYVDAIRRAGGVPLLLPPGETRTDRWLDRLDGVVVAGGTDIDPVQYGQGRTPAVLIADAERDEAEIALTRGLLERDLSALFVCRGMQILNVTLGGTLHHHIPDLGMGDIHRDKEGLWAYHDIEAVEGSLVAEAMGAASVMTYSGHHQAIDDVAEGLTVTASAPDGIIEALEVDDASWAVGVQWHPEVSAHDDPTQQALFDRLVAGAR